MADFQYRINGGAWATVSGVTLPYTISAESSDDIEVRGIGAPVLSRGNLVFGISGLLSDDETGFTVVSNWESPPAGITFDTANGRLIASGAQGFTILRYPLPAPLVVGDPYAAIMDVTSLSGGNTRPRLEGGGPSYSHPIPVTYASAAMRRFVPAVAHTDLAIVIPSNFVGEISYINLFPLKDRIAAPADIYIFAGQSNMVGGGGLVDWDPSIDRPVAEAFVVSGFGRGADGYSNDGSGAAINSAFNSSYGIGDPVPMCHPVTHNSPNLGRVSPAAYIMRHLVDTAPPEAGRVSVAACMAAADTDLFFHWDPDNDARMFDLTVANVNALLARNPGSQVKGLFWCQGESSEPVGYAPLMKQVIDQMRGLWGAFPVVMMEIGGQPDWADTIAMNAEQAKLATGSGDASELSNCIFVDRPAGASFVSGDPVHYDGATNRVRGTDAGAAFLQAFADPI